MHTWQEFLTEQGARFSDSATSEVLGFEAIPDAAIHPENFIAPLTDLGLITLTGEDAAHFLHNQLTNDVEHLSASEARLAGYCSPKGRLLATFLMWKSADTIVLQLPRELQAAVQKRLQMFVMRAKATLADVTDQQVILGLSGSVATAALTAWFASPPTTPYTKVESAAGVLIRVADASSVARYQWITTSEQAISAWPQLLKTLQAVATSTWRLSEIHAAIPHITAATQEQFVPQMINFEVIGGVNFKKGCYPGQEIVARSQYLGKLKRRMLPATIETQDAKAGMDVFSGDDPEQPCGMIVNAEHSTQNTMDCLVEIKTATMESSAIFLGSATGPTLKFLPLPYTLFDPT